MHTNSRLLFEKHAASCFHAGARVLEIGPDGDPSTFRKLVGDRVAAWETLDLAPRPGVDHVAASEYDFGLPEGGYDIVLSAQVIEHVRKVWVWIREVARVCKPGGMVITINPVSWPYHEAPIDCWRMYPEAMRALYDEAGLSVDVCEWGSLDHRGRNESAPTLLDSGLRRGEKD